MRPSLFNLSLALGLAGCWGRNIEYDGKAPSGDSGEPPDVVECGDESSYGDGWRIEGTAIFQDTGEGGIGDTSADALSVAGLCIDAIDPTPALAGGPPTVLASSKICDDGRYVISGIKENPAIGAFVRVDDCGDSGEDLVMTSATGISGAFVAGLGPGDALTGITARIVSQEYRTTLLEDLQTAGYDGTTEAEFKFLAGRITTDEGMEEGEPLDDYTIECGACVYPPFYADPDVSDGIFGSGATANTSTDEDANAFFLVPEAAIGTYTCFDGNGAEGPTSTYGSLPGYGVFIEFRCPI